MNLTSKEAYSKTVQKVTTLLVVRLTLAKTWMLTLLVHTLNYTIRNEFLYYDQACCRLIHFFQRYSFLTVNRHQTKNDCLLWRSKILSIKTDIEISYHIINDI
jgi:hypothetical protein